MNTLGVQTITPKVVQTRTPKHFGGANHHTKTYQTIDIIATAAIRYKLEWSGFRFSRLVLHPCSRLVSLSSFSNGVFVI